MTHVALLGQPLQMRQASPKLTNPLIRRTASSYNWPRYSQALITQIARTAVCNRHQAVEQQLCRWLLLFLDRLPSN